MSHHIPEAVTWCLAVALAAVAVLLIRQRRITTAVRARVAALEENVQARDDEAARLVTVRLPSVADSVHKAAPLPGLQDERLTGTEFAQSLQSVMELFARAVDKAQERVDQSAKAALKASMRALQGLAHEQQLAISRMQERHDNPDVLQDLLEIDHANSQFGRRAQAIAVLCGSWPGRQRVSSQLTDVVRGATSRIRDYRRVRVRGHGELAVVSRAVEPVVLAVAELLDNAARHSQPNTAVEVSLQPVHNGACVVIDDAGIGMDGQELQRAAALLAGRRAVDVSRLGDPPQFGFPVIGVLATRYGFSVSVDTSSPYGGVRAVLFLPSALLVNPDLDGPSTTPLAAPSRAGAAESAPYPPARHRDDTGYPAVPSHPDDARYDAPVTPATPAAQPPQNPTGTTAGGLPKRRRRQPARQAPRPQTAQPLPPEATPQRTPEETARRMGAFARGTRAGRTPAYGTPTTDGTPAPPGAPVTAGNGREATDSTAPHTPASDAALHAPATTDNSGGPAPDPWQTAGQRSATAPESPEDAADRTTAAGEPATPGRQAPTTFNTSDIAGGPAISSGPGRPSAGPRTPGFPGMPGLAGGSDAAPDALHAPGSPAGTGAEDTSGSPVAAGSPDGASAGHGQAVPGPQASSRPGHPGVDSHRPGRPGPAASGVPGDAPAAPRRAPGPYAVTPPGVPGVAGGPEAGSGGFPAPGVPADPSAGGNGGGPAASGVPGDASAAPRRAPGPYAVTPPGVPGVAGGSEAGSGGFPAPGVPADPSAGGNAGSPAAPGAAPAGPRRAPGPQARTSPAAPASPEADGVPGGAPAAPWRTPGPQAPTVLGDRGLMGTPGADARGSGTGMPGSPAAAGTDGVPRRTPGGRHAAGNTEFHPPRHARRERREDEGNTRS